MTEFLVVRLTLLSQNLTHAGDLEKNFKFLKEVKILSNFVQSKLACLMPIYVRGRRPPEVTPTMGILYGG